MIDLDHTLLAVLLFSCSKDSSDGLRNRKLQPYARQHVKNHALVGNARIYGIRYHSRKPPIILPSFPSALPTSGLLVNQLILTGCIRCGQPGQLPLLSSPISLELKRTVQLDDCRRA